MLKNIWISVFLFASFYTANAQGPWITDSVMMGPGQFNDIFYALPTEGSVKTESNANWHLAFCTSSGDSAAIWANHNSGNQLTKVFHIHKPGTDWSSVSLTDTQNAKILYNGETGWYQGALNQSDNPSPFNFGWGTYDYMDVVNHPVNGDSIFIVRTLNGPNVNYHKVFIVQLLGVAQKWIVKHENLSSLTAITYLDTFDINPGFTDRNFIYLDLNNHTTLDREPSKSAWDFVFTKYTAQILLGPPPAVPYNVMGLLLNKNVPAVQESGWEVDDAVAQYPNDTTGWGKPSISEIGYDWKVYDQPNNIYIITDSNSYFIRSKVNDSIYQLQFLNYTSSSGNIVFRKRNIMAPVAVKDIQSAISSYALFPNPSNGNLFVQLDAKHATEATMNLFDLSGSLVSSRAISLHSGNNMLFVPIHYLSNGLYFISLQGKEIQISEKFTLNK